MEAQFSNPSSLAAQRLVKSISGARVVDVNEAGAAFRRGEDVIKVIGQGQPTVFLTAPSKVAVHAFDSLQGSPVAEFITKQGCSAYIIEHISDISLYLAEPGDPGVSFISIPLSGALRSYSSNLSEENARPLPPSIHHNQLQDLKTDGSFGLVLLAEYGGSLYLRVGSSHLDCYKQLEQELGGGGQGQLDLNILGGGRLRRISADHIQVFSGSETYEDAGVYPLLEFLRANATNYTFSAGPDVQLVAGME